MAITAITRDFTSSPNIVRIISTDTIAQVGTAGYLTAQIDNTTALNSGEFEWVVSDFVLVYASDGWDLFSIDADFGSLNVWTPGTGVAVVGAPVVAGNFPMFNGTSGNIEDSGIAASAFLPEALVDGHIFVGSALNVATDVAMSGDATMVNSGALTIANSAITNAKVSASAAIAFSKLATLPSGQILIGSAGGVATAIALSGDATLVAAGTLTIANSAITNAKVSASAAIDFSKLAAMTSGNIIVGSAGTVPTSVTMSGDATIIASGALTIAANAVTTAKILNSNVTLAKLAAGITPSHVVKFAGQLTTVGGAAAEAFSIPGALAAGDLAFVQMVAQGSGTVTALIAVVTNDTLTVTFSANPQNDAIFNYQILRAAA